MRGGSWNRYALFGWAAVYGAFGLVSALSGTALFYRAAEPLPVGLNWVVVAIAVLAAVAASAASQPWGRRVVLGLSVLSGVAAFGLLMDVITLVFNQTVDSWTATANRSLAAVGVVLLIAVARSYRSAAHGGCPRCGDVHTSATEWSRPEPTAAPRRIRLLAYTGAVSFLPYAAMKTVWALGGTIAGISGAEMLATAERNGASGVWLTLERWGIDATALLAVLGVVLLFGLTRPWGLAVRGRRVPRWLPLTPALIGAATLAPYGVVGVVYAGLASAGVVTVPRGDFPTPEDALLVTWFGLGPFAVYGVALGAAAWSYLRRTQRVCVPRRIGWAPTSTRMTW
ncbi:hypothetical protein [Herbidospora cretacea]|uniref:hypothetical protein n=1 Tax=Herbidospora cretacea TaxID=28444 RepID=UPI000773E28D|nr:hypothetical protein [Herbidospora cretacea]